MKDTAKDFSIGQESDIHLEANIPDKHEIPMGKAWQTSHKYNHADIDQTLKTDISQATHSKPHLSSLS